jgi:hypothetical protein
MNGYSMEVTAFGVVIRGSVPLMDMSTINALAKERGFTILDVGAASALEASMVITSPEGSKQLRAEIDKKNADKSAEMKWLTGYDTGISSKVIFAVMTDRTGEITLDERGNPWDPSDFGRCYRLLKLFPAWRARIGEMAAVSPRWAALVARWDELEKLYEEEMPQIRAPQLYALMQELTR